MRAITNATPLIYLAKLGKLDLLKELYTEVITTAEVKKEILQQDHPEYFALKLAFDKWITIYEIVNNQRIDELLSQIDLGESSIIALALEQNEEIILIIDDLVARSIVKSLKIRFTGTLGVIVDAVYSNLLSKQEGVNLVNDLLDKTPFRMTTRLYRKIVSLIESI
ncbi:MAG: hypothetical protein INQ03_08405 [Candidatus Heimdallarchaeota archaeon]|nr:hypothetical protein [Candidatus Heimdallarchaeota archaeon]